MFSFYLLLTKTFLYVNINVTEDSVNMLFSKVVSFLLFYTLFCFPPLFFKGGVFLY